MIGSSTVNAFECDAECSFLFLSFLVECVFLNVFDLMRSFRGILLLLLLLFELVSLFIICTLQSTLQAYFWRSELRNGIRVLFLFPSYSTHLLR